MPHSRGHRETTGKNTIKQLEQLETQRTGFRTGVFKRIPRPPFNPATGQGRAGIRSITKAQAKAAKRRARRRRRQENR